MRKSVPGLRIIFYKNKIHKLKKPWYISCQRKKEIEKMVVRRGVEVFVGSGGAGGMGAAPLPLAEGQKRPLSGPDHSQPQHGSGPAFGGFEFSPADVLCGQ
jgi:hypothetical protein